jgi:acetyl esterase/lipase
MLKSWHKQVLRAVVIAAAALAVLVVVILLLGKGAPGKDKKEETAVGKIVPTSGAPQVIRLWPGRAPGSENWTQKETEIDTKDERLVRNVVDPELTAYFPATGKANGTSVIICPGGGFHMLSMGSEGIEVAHYLNTLGVTAFVLKYRLTRTSTDYPLVLLHRLKTLDNMKPVINEMTPFLIADGQQAVRLVRNHARSWGLEPDRIGMIGFSAGGYLTLNVALHHTTDSRPDFIAAIYPLAPAVLGPLNEKIPLFLLCADDDPLVSPEENSVQIYDSWHDAKIPVELHILAMGGHGFGMTRHHMPTDDWYELYRSWLSNRNLLSARDE